MKITPGTTDVSTIFNLGETGLDVTTFTLYYTRLGAAQVGPAVVTALANAASAHADNKAFEIGLGLYRVDWPDAAFEIASPQPVEVVLTVKYGTTDFEHIAYELKPEQTGDAYAEAAAANAHAHTLDIDWADGGRLDLILDSAIPPGTIPGGAVAWTYTVTLDGAACQGAAVRFYSDAGYTTFVQGGITNESGEVVFHLLPATYYIVVDAPGQERAYDSEVVV